MPVDNRREIWDDILKCLYGGIFYQRETDVIVQ